MSANGIALRAMKPLLDAGYRIISENFGDGVDDGEMTLAGPAVRAHLIVEHGKWFLELGSVADREWFDVRTALQALGDQRNFKPPGNRFSLYRFVEQILNARDRWEAAFGPAQYPDFREKLHALELASSIERFGYPRVS